jgi:hypothetical protein
MSRIESPKPRKTRRDGWTAERQLCFLDALVITRNIAQAAAFAGMSREGAHRLRNRREGALFGLLWDRILAPTASSAEVHTGTLTEGQLARLLGNHFRRERGDFRNIGAGKPDGRAPDRTRT